MYVCMYVFTQAMDSRHHGQRRRSSINPKMHDSEYQQVCIYTHTCMNAHISRHAHAHINPKMHDSEYQQEPALLCIPDLNPVQFLN